MLFTLTRLITEDTARSVICVIYDTCYTYGVECSD